MNAWQTVLLAIAGNGVVVAALAFVGKALVETFLARESERFRLELQHTADWAIEQLKSELQLGTIEHCRGTLGGGKLLEPDGVHG